MKQLKDYLGIWSYTHGSADLFYKVHPVSVTGENYRITWGASEAELDNPKQRMNIVNATEAFRRIRTKARGGYTLIKPYTGVMPPSADLSVEDLYPNKPDKPTPPAKPKKPKFNFLDWVAGKDFS